MPGYLIYELTQAGAQAIVGSKIGLLVGIFIVAAVSMRASSSSSRTAVRFCCSSESTSARSSGEASIGPISSIRSAISLRARTLNGQRLKVNDQVGNPVEIAAIIIWQVVDTYKASFEVDRYEDFVALQSETALRHSGQQLPVRCRRGPDFPHEEHGRD